MTAITPPVLDIEPFAVLDGGLSTALESLGEHPAGLLWTAALLVDRPEVLVCAHRLAVEAGADVVISASYQASEAGLTSAGTSAADARRAIASTTELARRSGARAVAASVGPYGAVLGDGSEYSGRYDASWDEVRRFHRERLRVLGDTAADVLAVETIPSRIEAEIVVEEALAVTSLPMWVTFTCRDATSTWSGDVLADAVAAVADERVVAVGVNCTAPALVAPLLASIDPDDPRPKIAYPNHGGTWDAADDRWLSADDGDTPVDHIADHVAEWLALGARVIGGCCGVGPDEVRRLAARRAQLAASTVELGQDVGE
jgi:homocysteine S-methyltransferase